MHGYAMERNKQELGDAVGPWRLRTGVLGGSKITIPNSKAQSCHPCLSRRGSRPSAVKPSTGLCIDCEQQLAKEVPVGLSLLCLATVMGEALANDRTMDRGNAWSWRLKEKNLSPHHPRVQGP